MESTTPKFAPYGNKNLCAQHSAARHRGSFLCTGIRPSHFNLQRNRHCFIQFPAISRCSFKFHPFTTMSSCIQTYLAIPAISIYFQPFPANHIHIQQLQIVPNIFSHFQLLSAISSYYQPFQAFPSHTIIFQ